MKIFLKAFIEKNLGDDLFIDILIKRYPKERFLINNKANYLKYKNLFFYKKGLLQKIIGKILYYISFKNINYESLISLQCKLSILIGGSMFIENSSEKIVKLKKPLFIVGSNFGPFKNREYLEYYKKTFSSAYDVCFRDKKSYEYFKEMNNVRYSTDIVFSYKNSDIVIKNEKKVVISVIDCDFKEKELGRNYRAIYEKTILDLINYFHNKEYRVVLMSFCKMQGDEKAIQRLKENTKVDIDTFFYNGNINEALNVIASSSIVIGTRFHANILGILYNKTILPIAYSDKTINILEDMNYKGKIFDIRKIDELNVENLTDYDLNYKIDNINLISTAEKHFEKLDEILLKGGLNE